MRAYFYFCEETTMNYTSLLQDKRLTILLAGEIDHHTAREIMEAVTAKIDVYLPRRCVLDLGAVTFMDSRVQA